MKIDIQIDDAVLKNKTLAAQRQLVNATVRAINYTALEMQKLARAKLLKTFTVRPRSKDFMVRNAAVVKPFASVSQGRLFAEVAVGQKPKLLLSMYESGGYRTPTRKKLAIPVTGGLVRPTLQSDLNKAYYIKALKLRKTKNGLQGANDTFANDKGIYKRLAGGAVDMLYKFASRVKLPAKLGFLATAGTYAEKELGKNIALALNKLLPRN